MQEINLIRNAFLVAGQSSEPIFSITGDKCTACACKETYGAPAVIADLPASHDCRADWQSSLQDIAADSPYLTDVEGLYLDPWGAPYLLDENELEFSDDPCRADIIKTAGADSVLNTTDDYAIALPFRTSECKS